MLGDILLVVHAIVSDADRMPRLLTASESSNVTCKGCDEWLQPSVIFLRRANINSFYCPALHDYCHLQQNQRSTTAPAVTTTRPAVDFNLSYDPLRCTVRRQQTDATRVGQSVRLNAEHTFAVTLPATPSINLSSTFDETT